MHFINETGTCPHKVGLITVPKSGTWMYVNILKHFNLVFTGINITAQYYIDHRNDDLTGKMAMPLQTVYQPMAKSLNMVKPGQFTTSHWYPGLANLVPTDWKKIFTIRNARMLLISEMRWRDEFDETNPSEMMRYLNDKGPKILQRLKQRLGWLNRGTHVIQFEQVVGDEDQRKVVLDGLANFLNTTYDPQALDQVGSKSMTYTGKHSTLEEFWTGKAEAWFVKNGGPAINTQMGYKG